MCGNETWPDAPGQLDEIRNESRRLTDGESEDSADDDESVIAVANRTVGDHHAFVFGYRSADVDLRSLHPLPSQIPYMWQLYQENVDPIVKVLHTPTVDKLIKETRKDLDSLTPPNEALMFAIYYAAITSINDADVSQKRHHYSHGSIADDKVIYRSKQISALRSRN